MNEIVKYFPDLNPKQIEQFAMLEEIYKFWNAQINVISRKDIDQIYTHHVLHSLAIAKVIKFLPNTKILDVGTGGGFPGIPLAIMFPESHFLLVDSIGKKIRVVKAVIEGLKLKNVEATQTRAEELKQKFDFVTSRAVTDLPSFVAWVWNKIEAKGFNALPNGVLYLKGGDLSEEIKATPVSKRQISVYDINSFFDDSFFETKKVVYLQR